MKGPGWRVVRSMRLALATILVLAGLAAVASLRGTEDARVATGGDQAQTPRTGWMRGTVPGLMFLAASGVLVLNVAACTLHRARLRGKPGAAATADVALHLGLLVLVAGGALRATSGFVGTLGVAEGTATQEVFVGGVGPPVPLGFSVGLERLEMSYYPVRARIGVREARSGEKVALLEVREGGMAGDAGRGVRVRLDRVVRDAGAVQCSVATPEGESAVLLSLRGGEASSAEIAGFSFTLVAYRDDLKMVQALMSAAFDDGRRVEQWISPNRKMQVGGASLHLTAWRTDEFGIRQAGLQVTEDPGAPLFWAGCLLFASSLGVRLALRARALGVGGAHAA